MSEDYFSSRRSRRQRRQDRDWDRDQDSEKGSRSSWRREPEHVPSYHTDPGMGGEMGNGAGNESGEDGVCSFYVLLLFFCWEWMERGCLVGGEEGIGNANENKQPFYRTAAFWKRFSVFLSIALSIAGLIVSAYASLAHPNATLSRGIYPVLFHVFRSR